MLSAFPRGLRRRWPVVAASLMAAVGTVTVAALTAPRDEGQSGKPETVLGAAGSAPPHTTAAPTGAQDSAALEGATGVALRDEQRSVTITWQDPSGGKAVARLVVSRDGQELFVGDVAAGVDHYRLDGLSPDLNLCATVTLLYNGVAAPASDPVCTDR
jgi:hypothetical protein